MILMSVHAIIKRSKLLKTQNVMKKHVNIYKVS